MILRSASARPPPAAASLMVPFHFRFVLPGPRRVRTPERRQVQSRTIPSYGQGIRRGLAIALRCCGTPSARQPLRGAVEDGAGTTGSAGQEADAPRLGADSSVACGGSLCYPDDPVACDRGLWNSAVSLWSWIPNDSFARVTGDVAAVARRSSRGEREQGVLDHASVRNNSQFARLAGLDGAFDLTPTTGRGGCSAAFPTGGLPPAIRSLERRSL